jgi:tetratricopeptide (TPR) repeat protein
MWLQVTPTATGPLGAIDLNWVVAIGTLAAALGAILGNWIAHRSARKADMAQQVSKEVEAKIGTVLMSLRALEDEARKQLTQLATILDRKQQELTTAVQDKEEALRHLVTTSAQQAQEIEAILNRAHALIPLVGAAELVPIQLLSEAESAGDATAKTACLLRILEHPDSDAPILERAGDLARQQLSNRSLAARLYKRATELDPERITARAEYLALLAYVAAERGSARNQILELAKTFPNDATVMNCLVNFFIRVGDYKGLLDSVTPFLHISRRKALLWRNIAVAREELGAPSSEIEEAYENALALGDEGAYVNAARPYIPYLITKGELDKAEAILNRALSYQPGEGELHVRKGDLHRRRGEYSLAVQSYQWADRVGDAEDKILARRRLRQLELLQQLGLTAAAGAERSPAPRLNA